ncbi:hypothetical protein FK513_29870, partial [Klebsiella pneumoniae]|nr:hypothetical protein [Klebsiella pneumoniae]
KRCLHLAGRVRTFDSSASERTLPAARPLTMLTVVLPYSTGNQPDAAGISAKDSLLPVVPMFHVNARLVIQHVIELINVSRVLRQLIRAHGVRPDH